MIHILPHLEYSINSSKSPEEINEILNSVTHPAKMRFCASFDVKFTRGVNLSDVEFAGEVNVSDLKIVREVPGKIYLKNDFRPVIKGNIRIESGMSVIDIKMCLYLFVQIFLAIYFGGVGISFLSGLFTIFAKGVNGGQMLVSSVALFVFVQAFARIGFYFPAQYAKRRLEELLK